MFFNIALDDMIKQDKLIKCQESAFFPAHLVLKIKIHSSILQWIKMFILLSQVAGAQVECINHNISFTWEG
jgi:hypothetical protein